jgi:histidyl-tRNA synthetase
MNLQTLRGMKDLLPEDYLVHEHIINKAKRTFELYGCKPISTPIIEYTKVFDRSLGDTSDVISKEIYSFLDRNQENVALRPEFTAGVIRAFVSGLQHQKPIKLFSYGPVFRYDRPQAGRQRQFHQFNFEYIGAEGPHTDAETIKLAADILGSLNITEYNLEINSLGCVESRGSYHTALKDYFSNYKDNLSQDSLKRLDKNPLRILDSKDEEDKKIVRGAPLLSDHYTNESREYFTKVLEYLDALGINYIVNPKLVRGLDYYCHTAFEFVSSSPKLGAQSTILGGGRYDGLVKLMGGADAPGIGFGAGIERLALVGEYSIKEQRPIVVLPIEPNNLTAGLLITDNLRQKGIKTTLDEKGKIGKRMERALNANAACVIFVGEEEEKTKTYKLKDLDKKIEYSFTFKEIIQYCSEMSGQSKNSP